MGLLIGTVAMGVMLALLFPDRLEFEGPAMSPEASSEASREANSEANSRVDPEESRPIPAAWDRVRVEVLNGGGVAGVAGRARDRLREAGFDVVYFGNAASFGTEASVILGRGQDEAIAAAVAAALGIPSVLQEPDPSRHVDVTVLLGTDWDGVETIDFGAQTEDDRARSGTKAWWDFRRFLDGTR